MRGRSERHHGSDALALVHKIEGIVDLIKRHGMSNHLIDIDLAFHVPINNFGYVRAATRTTERRPAP